MYLLLSCCLSVCVQVMVVVFYCCVCELTRHALHTSSPNSEDETLLHIAKASPVVSVISYHSLSLKENAYLVS